MNRLGDFGRRIHGVNCRARVVRVPECGNISNVGVHAIDKASGRTAQRMITRERAFNAAIAEFQRVGMANADVSAIAAAAGIARGTFYFHFPTKEDVLLELTRREEVLIGAEIRTASDEYADLETVLTEMIRRVVAAESRLGTTLFRDVLSFYFSTTQPDAVDPAMHPLTEVVADHIKRGRRRGDVHPDVDPTSSAIFFLLGLYALLATDHRPKRARAAMLKKYVRSVMHGLVRH